ncbi:MAG: histidinol-phosphatase, partial [Chitinophagaceae bacterium]
MLGFLLCSSLTGFAQTTSLKWYKGNTHTHSLWSDGNDFPEMIMDW